MHYYQHVDMDVDVNEDGVCECVGVGDRERLCVVGNGVRDRAAGLWNVYAMYY